MNQTDLAKKTVVITGAAGNLGKATVRKFASDGYRIVSVLSPGKKTGAGMEGNSDAYAVDLTDEKNVQAFGDELLKKYIKIDAAVLLVGGFAPGKLSETDATLLRQMIALNFESAFHLSRIVFQQMLSQPEGGRIVLVGSRPSLEPSRAKNAVAYSLSKSLLFNLAACQNAEGQSRNVVTAVVVPGTIDTPENRKSDPNANFDQWVTPEEIADAIAFICKGSSKSLRDPVIKMYGKG
jgi:NAD(P)-dependent dehydrogenase (short-subunit alcohol dehydrogenase family)